MKNGKLQCKDIPDEPQPMTADEKMIWASVFAVSQAEIIRNKGIMTRCDLITLAQKEADATIHTLRRMKERGQVNPYFDIGPMGDDGQ